MIGGVIVGSVALVAALSWFIVKRIIKKKVDNTGFKLLGSDLDITDDENPESVAL